MTQNIIPMPLTSPAGKDRVTGMTRLPAPSYARHRPASATCVHKRVFFSLDLICTAGACEAAKTYSRVCLNPASSHSSCKGGESPGLLAASSAALCASSDCQTSQQTTTRRSAAAAAATPRMPAAAHDAGSSIAISVSFFFWNESNKCAARP